MKLSARNVLKCKVKRVKAGAVKSEIILELPNGGEIVSIITLAGLKALDRRCLVGGKNLGCDLIYTDASGD